MGEPQLVQGPCLGVESCGYYYLVVLGAARFESTMNTAPSDLSGPDLATFRSRWIGEFELYQRLYCSGQKSRINCWEGFEAVRELSETGNLWIVLPDEVREDETQDTMPGKTLRDTEAEPFRQLTAKLFNEVLLYHCFHRDIGPANTYFKEAVAALTAARNKLAKLQSAGASHANDVAFRLKRPISAIDDSLAELEKFRASYWQNRLLAIPEERSRWSVYLDQEKRVHSIPPEDLQRSEALFQKAAYPRELVKRIDLDRRFQIRVGLILRTYLLREIVSLRTINRLILLTYKAGDLGEEADERLLVEGRTKPITVSNVDLKIRAAGLK